MLFKLEVEDTLQEDREFELASLLVILLIA